MINAAISHFSVECSAPRAFCDSAFICTVIFYSEQNNKKDRKKDYYQIIALSS